MMPTTKVQNLNLSLQPPEVRATAAKKPDSLNKRQAFADELRKIKPPKPLKAPKPQTKSSAVASSSHAKKTTKAKPTKPSKTRNESASPEESDALKPAEESAEAQSPVAQIDDESATL